MSVISVINSLDETEGRGGGTLKFRDFESAHAKLGKDKRRDRGVSNKQGILLCALLLVHFITIYIKYKLSQV